jgi:hypothetical protein
MALSAQAEQKMQAERDARNKQDKKHPFVINIDDGRLLPNIPNLREHPKYRVYKGDPKASAEERLRHLAVTGHGPRVIDSGDAVPSAPLFDIAKATREELVEFAAAQYHEQLDPNMHLATLRASVRALAQSNNDLAT